MLLKGGNLLFFIMIEIKMNKTEEERRCLKIMVGVEVCLGMNTHMRQRKKEAKVR